MRTIGIVLLSMIALPSAMSLASEHLPFGKPADGFPIEHPSYVAGYKSSLRSPLWVAYTLKPENCKGFKRLVYSKPPLFQDPIVLEKGLNSASPDDYEQSGYWPLPLITHSDSMGREPQSEKDSFSLAVMVAQTQSRDTRKLWKDLEELIRSAVADYGELWIITGPVFGDGPDTTARGKIGVAESFYKIAVRKDAAGKMRAVAWLIPQNATGEPKRFITTIDEVEKATKLDFLADVPPDIQNELEAKKGTTLGEAKTASVEYSSGGSAAETSVSKKPSEVIPDGPAAVPSDATQVWALKKKSFYYKSGSPWYGKGQGQFMSTDEAQMLGFKEAIDKSASVPESAAEPKGNVPPADPGAALDTAL